MVKLYAMNGSLLKDLNVEQQKAVERIEGPVIILAGAGSGKTRCIVYRVLHMIEKGIEPSDILCVTFTNKAASEMRERIQKHLSITKGKPGSSPLITTYHSFCARVMRRDGKYIGISSRFTIYDEQDQLDTVKETMKKLGVSPRDYKPSSVLATISQAKNELLSPSEYASLAFGQFQKTVSDIYPLYQQLLKENDALDFDDLLLQTIFLFEQYPSVLKNYQERYKFILVDEYQDTNKAQYYLTKLLGGKYKNVCVVGDFSQSIYSWRGADFQNLTKFKADFPKAKTFSLSQNYRSTQKILDSASAVITKNTTHPVLALWTSNPAGEDILLYEAANQQDEAEFIINQIGQLKYEIKNHSDRFSYKDVAVLYRTNAQSRAIEEVFLHKGVPYNLVGGTRFYERKEIKDVLALLRTFLNDKDMVSYKRVEKIGKSRLLKLLELKKSEAPLKESETIEIMDRVVKKTDYLSLYDENEEDDRQRLENIKELRSVALQFPNAIQFLENVALVEQEHMPDYPSTGSGQIHKDAVTFMTMHAAKGLEFECVFMVGMEEGIFPHSRSLMDRNELEEERRLCYVGMTRAKKKLILTYARQRLFFGQRLSNMVSRFLLDLPPQLIDANFHEFQNRQSRTMDLYDDR